MGSGGGGGGKPPLLDTTKEENRDIFLAVHFQSLPQVTRNIVKERLLARSVSSLVRNAEDGTAPVSRPQRARVQESLGQGREHGFVEHDVTPIF